MSPGRFQGGSPDVLSKETNMSERTEKLRQLLSAAAGRIAVTGHDGADVDSVISCVLMQRLLERA